jgi:hypothetical protein
MDYINDNNVSIKSFGAGKRNRNQELQGQPLLDRTILHKIQPSHKKENKHFPVTIGRIRGENVLSKVFITPGFNTKIPIFYSKFKMLVRRTTTIVY